MLSGDIGEGIRGFKMPLNKRTPHSNMYPFISATWNPIRGECLHSCIYCYCKNPRFGKQGPLRLVEKELKTNLGKDRFIFIGSSTDMFASNVSREWIRKVMRVCNLYSENKYLFQTKNPDGFWPFEWPKNTIFAVTLETNRDYGVTKAPNNLDRIDRIFEIETDYPLMISIEPVIDFDLDVFIDVLKRISPAKISIGADSQGHHLPEPKPEKLKELISACKDITADIVLKDNLMRLLK